MAYPARTPSAVPTSNSKAAAAGPSEGMIFRNSVRPRNEDVNKCPSNEERGTDGREDRTLQFLPVHTPQGPPNPDHKRSVRSHVMRSFHSRRKRQQTRPVTIRRILQKGSYDSNPKKPGSLDAEPAAATSARARVSSSSNELHSPTGTVVSSFYPSPSLSESSALVLHNQGGDVVTNEEASSRFHRTAIERNMHAKTDGTRLVGFLPQLDRQCFETTTPYALVQADGAPCLFMRCIKWPLPQQVGGLGPTISVWIPSSFISPPSPRQQPSCMHMGARILPSIHNSAEYFTFKIQTIKWINSRLLNGDLGLSDSTLGSIILLAELELGHGNIPEVITHMNAIERIVSLRGGINNFLNNGEIRMKISILDLTSAVMGSNCPRFPIFHSPLPMLPPLNSPDTTIVKVTASPLHSDDPLQTILQDSGFGEESIQILQHMQALTTLTISGLITEVSTPLENPNPGTHYHDAHTTTTLLRTIQLTSKIYHLALLNPPTAFSSPLNKSTAQELCLILLNSAHDATWDHYPGILTWCLLTGAAATQNGMQEHSFFVSFLLKACLGAGYGWWEEMIETLRVFGRIKMRAERRS